MNNYQIPEGWIQEPYTPAATRVTSTFLGGAQLKWCKFMVATAGSVTWRDTRGNQNTMALLAGTVYPFLVTEISASAGAVIIIHDGQKYIANNP